MSNDNIPSSDWDFFKLGLKGVLNPLKQCLLSPCIKWLALCTGLMSILTSYLVSTRPYFGTQDIGTIPSVELHDSWVIQAVMTKSLLICLIVAIFLKLFKFHKSACRIIAPLFLGLFFWGTLIGQLPIDVSYKNYTDTSTFYIRLNSENRVVIKLFGKKTIDKELVSIDSESAEPVRVSCIDRTTWWLGNLRITKDYGLRELKVKPINSSAECNTI